MAQISREPQEYVHDMKTGGQNCAKRSRQQFPVMLEGILRQKAIDYHSFFPLSRLIPGDTRLIDTRALPSWDAV